jgi:hypothetical protein
MIINFALPSFRHNSSASGGWLAEVQRYRASSYPCYDHVNFRMSSGVTRTYHLRPPDLPGPAKHAVTIGMQ